MYDCTLAVLEKQRKRFLEEVRFDLKFLRRGRFLLKLKIVQTGNRKNLWKSKADKSFHFCKHLICVIQWK